MKTTDKNWWAETKAPLLAPLSASREVSRNYRENRHEARWKPPITSCLVQAKALASEYKLRHFNWKSMTERNYKGWDHIIILVLIRTEPLRLLLTPNPLCEDLRTIDSRQNVYRSYSLTEYRWEINSYPIALIWHKYLDINICMEIDMLRLASW